MKGDDSVHSNPSFLWVIQIIRTVEEVKETRFNFNTSIATRESHCTKKKFWTKDFFSKCDQIRRILRIWSRLLKKSLMENLILVQVSWKLFYVRGELRSRVMLTHGDMRPFKHGLTDPKSFVLKSAILSVMRVLGSIFFHSVIVNG